MISFQPFEPAQQEELAEFVLQIQNGEFGLGFTREGQPDLMDTSRFYQGGGFWTAVCENKIVGCVGLQKLNPEYGILRKLFVARAFRGKDPKIALTLFNELRARASRLGLEKILLDSPSIAKASHRFYAKQGFVEIPRENIPKGYSYPDRDSMIFELDLKRKP